MDSDAASVITTRHNRTYRRWNRERFLARVAARQNSGAIETPTRRKRIVSSSSPLRRSPRIKALNPRRSSRIQALKKNLTKTVPVKKKVARHANTRIIGQPKHNARSETRLDARLVDQVVKAAQVIVNAFRIPIVRRRPITNRAYVQVPARSLGSPRNVDEDVREEIFDVGEDDPEADTDVSGDYYPNDYEENEEDF
ncbi:hypothetical protein VKT23_020399 [Stygiomarasmius scandens]|uniref:Uncharacterized protein n=1 Tax=Marasmiellus scandens TaxID=2682957 RepID=A0ABR1IJ59_9AGAR